MKQQILNSIEAADIVVIIAAIIAAIISIITAIITVVAEKKTNNKVTNFQREWNQRQLDADLKSKARIEWIQKVRDTTSELLALYFKVLNEKDKGKLFDSYTVARQKSELLILYFGPENIGDEKSIDKLYELEKKSTSVNKSIVDIIDQISKRFYEYYSSVMNDHEYMLKKQLDDTKLEMYNNTIGEVNKDFIWDDGHKFPLRVPTINPLLYQNHKSAKDDLKNYQDFKFDLENDLIQLRDIMRIYLKVEWNIAKKGE